MKVVLTLIALVFNLIFGQQSEYHALLPICTYDSFSINELYSPMTIGYQLIKRGFCLVFNNGPLDKPVATPTQEQITTMKQDLQTQPGNKDYTSIWQKTIAALSDSLKPNINPKKYKPYDPVLIPTDNITIIQFPISLSNGLCLNKMSPVRYLESKRVSCSYPINMAKGSNKDITLPFETITTKECYEIRKSTNTIILITDCTLILTDTFFFRKIELTIAIKDDDNIQDIIVKYYLESSQNNQYIGINYDVTFKKVTSFPKSGNPGYIQSHPLLSGSNNDSLPISDIKLYLEKRLFNGVDQKGNCFNVIIDTPSNYYYEPNIDNSLTFEKSILYGCELINNQQVKSSLLLQDLKNKTYSHVSQFGNGRPGNRLDWLEIINNNNFGETNNNLVTLNFLYADVGAVNNTQSMLMYIDFKQDSNTLPSNRIYVKSNFFKYPLPSTKWYAPDPGFIRLPRNIMYPFRIGTTNYTQSSCYINAKIGVLIMAMIVIFTT